MIDCKATRFGWGQVTFDGAKVLLNGERLILRGDSWHFMGIPQMTRRYAWAWFTAMREAGLNAARLHAQPYPEFYLDVADEMGILVLDETAVWASDGGPKLDDSAFFERGIGQPPAGEEQALDLRAEERQKDTLYFEFPDASALRDT